MHGNSIDYLCGVGSKPPNNLTVQNTYAFVNELGIEVLKKNI